VLERHSSGVVEAGFCEQAQPGDAGEETLDVAVVLDANRAVGLAEEVGEVDGVGGVVGVGVPGPLEVAEAAAVRPVVAAVVGGGTEVLGEVVGGEEGYAPEARVDEGGRYGGRQMTTKSPASRDTCRSTTVRQVR